MHRYAQGNGRYDYRPIPWIFMPRFRDSFLGVCTDDYVMGDALGSGILFLVTLLIFAVAGKIVIVWRRLR